MAKLDQGFLNTHSTELIWAFADAATDAVFIETIEGDILYANKTAVDAYGYSLDEFRELNVTDIVSDEIAANLEAVKEQHFKGGGIHVEAEGKRKDGSIFPTEVSTKLIEVKGNTLVVVFVKDNTARQAAELELRTGQERFNRFTSNVSDVIFRFDVQKKEYDFVSSSFEQMTGYPSEKLLRSKAGFLEQMIHPLDIYAYRQALRNHIKKGAGGGTLQTEFRVIRRDGAIIRVRNHITLDYSQDGKLCWINGVGRDITREWEAEQQLRLSEQQYRSTIDSMSDALHVVGRDLQIILVNNKFKEWCSELGFPTDIVGKTIFEAFPFLPEAIGKEYEKVFSTGEMLISEEENLFEGKMVVTETRKIPLKSKGKVRQVVTLIRDITDRKSAEDRIRKSEEKYRNLFENAQVGMFRIRVSDGLLIEANNILARMFGYTSPDAVVNKVYAADFYVNEEARETMLASLTYEGEVNNFEAHFRRKDGSTFWVQYSAKLFPDEDFLEGVLVDISLRKEALRLLQRKSAENEMLIDSIPLSVWYLKDIETFGSVNKTYAECLGKSKEEVEYRRIADVLGKDRYQAGIERARVVFEQKRSISYEKWEELPNGIKRLFFKTKSPVLDDESSVVHVICTAEDITERRSAEELELQMQRTAKLESLGVLAGGIAHDFNNLLVGILGNTELAIRKLPDDSIVLSNLRQVQSSALMASDLTKQLLAYSGKGKFVVEKLNLNLLVTEMTTLLQLSISKRAALELNISDESAIVEGDAAQLRQVLMNLITNASEALGDSSGVITLRSRVLDITEEYFAGNHVEVTPEPGRYCCIEITDTGCGVDDETLSKIFDPFFTTKFTGRGLGLAAVIGIINGHNGGLMVRSEPGSGTTITFCLPYVGQEEGEEKAESVEPKSISGSGHILVVDDEDFVRELAMNLLEELGYSVISACDGEEAVEVFKKEQHNIRAVLMDLTMPKMGGEEAFRLIRAIKPDARIILTSGYSEQVATSSIASEGLSGFLQKPYSIEAMINEFNRVLEES